LFAPCSRSGSLQAQVVRQGLVTKGGAQPLGLVFPAVAVGHGGELLLTFSYAGPGGVDSTAVPAFLGEWTYSDVVAMGWHFCLCCCQTGQCMKCMLDGCCVCACTRVWWQEC
jgi:hypothetical protein